VVTERDVIAERIQDMVIRQRSRNSGPQWEQLKPGQCALCGRMGLPVVPHEPQRSPPADIPMVEWLAQRLVEMADSQRIIDRSVLRHAAWMLREEHKKQCNIQAMLQRVLRAD